MNILTELLTYLYKHPFVRYLFVGGSTFAIDLGLLIILHGLADVGLTLATSLAYWTSIIYNFLLNRWWTFSAGEKANLRRHTMAYLTLLAFNYAFTILFVALASKLVFYGLAKALAVAVSVTWTYAIYKNFIFTKKRAITTDPLDT